MRIHGVSALAKDPHVAVVLVGYSQIGPPVAVEVRDCHRAGIAPAATVVAGRNLGGYAGWSCRITLRPFVPSLTATEILKAVRESESPASTHRLPRPVEAVARKVRLLNFFGFQASR